jgi:hypothetical protein
MSIGAGIYALLQSSASITDAVGQNVAPLVKQQQLVTPCIIYSIAGVTPQHTFTGGAKADVYDVSFHIFDKEYDRVISIARILRNVLDFKSGTYGGWEFRMVRFQGIADDFANDAELYGQTLTFTMRVKNDPTFGLPKVLKTLFSEVGQLHGSVVQVYSLLALCQSDGLMYSAIQLSNALESSCQQSGNFAGNVAVQELYKLTTSIAQSGEFAGRVVAGDTLEVAFLQTGQLGTEVQIAALLSLELVQQGNMSGALEIAAQLATDFEAVGTMQSTLQLAAVLGASYDADGYFGGDVEESISLLLDLYPNAAAAYSLRQLRTGVTNVVRLRRSSDNAEADFTATEITNGTLVSWVGAGNDGFITVIYNQAAVGGNNLTQTTTTKQVLLVQNGVLVMRGSNAAMFNDSIRDLRNTASINLSSGGSIYLAFETINDSSIHSVFGNRVDNSNRQFIGLASNTHVISSRVNAGGAGFIKSVGFTTFGKRLATYAQLDAANFNFKINNINSDGTQSPNVINAGGGVFLFTDGDALNRFNFQGYIFEVIIYDTNQSANDAAIESDINARYDIY